MNAPVRLIVFLSALAAVFAGAGFVGRAAAPASRGLPAEHSSADHEVAVPEVDGLTSSSAGLRLVVDPFTAEVATPAPLRFRIVDDRGHVQTRFDVEQERPLHLVVVRRDLTGFQHLHPVIDGTGTWSIDVTLPAAGSWRVFADFTVSGARHVLGADVDVPGDFRPKPLDVPSTVAHTDGFDVTLAGGDRVSFVVRAGGQPVTPDPYLGAAGHLVALRTSDLAYLHAHPVGGGATADFAVAFPGPGTYRLFFQFSAGGAVHTAAFTYEVAS